MAAPFSLPWRYETVPDTGQAGVFTVTIVDGTEVVAGLEAFPGAGFLAAVLAVPVADTDAPVPVVPAPVVPVPVAPAEVSAPATPDVPGMARVCPGWIVVPARPLAFWIESALVPNFLLIPYRVSPFCTVYVVEPG